MTGSLARLGMGAICAASLTAGTAWAGPVEAACMVAERGGDPALCSCIQSVADMTLDGGDQRLAASFFRDPDRAHKIQKSDSRRNDAFWERYTAFGEAAESFCAG